MDRVPANLRTLAALNPMALIVTGYRSSLLHLAQPSGIRIGSVLAASVVVFVIGGLLFRQAKPAFPDVL
jgi:ABC-type polysaccharide/polyol phosphate export permease